MKVKTCRVRIKIFKDIGIAINFDVLLNPVFEITTCYNIARNYSYHNQIYIPLKISNSQNC